jgi:hypothetical protein
MKMTITRTPTGDIQIAMDEETKAAHIAARFDFMEDARSALLEAMGDLEAAGLSGEPED